MKTILVVDDFATVRLYHANLLKRLGHGTEVASDGEEALNILRRQRIDMVLLDMLMPRMGGAEFLRRARAMPGYETLPVLIVSSEADEEQEQALVSAGASGFMKKPALPQAMVEMLKKHLA